MVADWFRVIMSKQKDQFADLFSAYAPKKKDDSKLSLAERQRNTPNSSSLNNQSHWANFDVLENSRSSSSLAKGNSVATPFSQSATPVNNNSSDLFEGFDVINNQNNAQVKPPSRPQQTSNIDLFEGFSSPAPSSYNNGGTVADKNEMDLLESFGDDFSSTNSSTPNNIYGTSNIPQQQQGEQNIDDLFAVFDQAPQKTKLENPIPTHSATQYEVLHSNVASPQSFQEDEPQQTRRQQPLTERRARQKAPSVNSEARDEAIASLIDMGFSIDQATDALNHTDNGVNVEAAVSYIMTAAHQKARAKAGLPPENLSRTSTGKDSRSGSTMKQAEQYFGAFANTVYKASDKLATDVVNRFFSPPADDSPAWMRDQQKYKARQRKYDEDPDELTEDDIKRLNLTDEGSKLETPRSSNNYQRAPVPPPRRKFHAQEPVPRRSQQNGDVKPRPRPRAEQPVPQAPATQEEEEIDIFAPLPQAPKQSVAPSASQRVKASAGAGEMMSSSSRRRPTSRSQAATPLASKPQRPLISMSSIEKETFSEYRERGGVAFKQGDFCTALEHYEKSLNALPKNHILSILAYSNCISAYFKVGENKKVVESANTALAIIGPTRGASEEIEPGKNMKDFWIKISQKKAEALEHLEKHKEALQVWSELVENGAANKVTLDGKKRCQDVLNPKPKETPRPKASTPVQRKPQSTPKPSSSGEGEALKRIRDTHQASQTLEDEKFRLHDQIEAKINSWKNGKEDNLRALLASLHEILWESTNWKKVSMADLVMPKKVKITYMKAVAKVHPDKIPQDATAEQKLIAQSVFVVINTAWEKFKAANNIQ